MFKLWSFYGQYNINDLKTYDYLKQEGELDED